MPGDAAASRRDERSAVDPELCRDVTRGDKKPSPLAPTLAILRKARGAPASEEAAAAAAAAAAVAAAMDPESMLLRRPRAPRVSVTLLRRARAPDEPMDVSTGVGPRSYTGCGVGGAEVEAVDEVRLSSDADEREDAVPRVAA